MKNRDEELLEAIVSLLETVKQLLEKIDTNTVKTG